LNTFLLSWSSANNAYNLAIFTHKVKIFFNCLTEETLHLIFFTADLHLLITVKQTAKAAYLDLYF
jgi:hypothetical protein